MVPDSFTQATPPLIGARCDPRIEDAAGCRLLWIGPVIGKEDTSRVLAIRTSATAGEERRWPVT